MKKTLMTLGLCTIMAFIAVPAVQATVFDFTSDHCTGGCGTVPFGTVTLDQNGTTVDVTVHLNSPNFFVLSGAGDTQNFKFNGTGVVLNDITVDQTVPLKTMVANSGAFNGDGTGNFGFGIACSDCGNGASGRFNQDIVFHVASATIAELTVPNNLGNLFVADIISCTSNACTGFTGPNGTGNTGVVDVTAPVPEPTSLMLLGLGLAGLGFVRRRKS